MLCGFAADQRRACLNTALRNTADNGSDLLRNIFAAGNVVQEEQRLCAAANNIIDAHRHRIDTDGVMLVHQNRQLNLGTAAIRSGNQHRLFHAGHGQTEAAAKATHVVQTTLIAGTSNVLFHQFDRSVTGSDIHAGCGIAGRMRIFVIHIC